MIDNCLIELHKVQVKWDSKGSYSLLFIYLYHLNPWSTTKARAAHLSKTSLKAIDAKKGAEYWDEHH